MEEVEILVHCATELPLIGGKPPAVFASVKSEQVKWLYSLPFPWNVLYSLSSFFNHNDRIWEESSSSIVNNCSIGVDKSTVGRITEIFLWKRSKLDPIPNSGR